MSTSYRRTGKAFRGYINNNARSFFENVCNQFYEAPVIENINKLIENIFRRNDLIDHCANQYSHYPYRNLLSTNKYYSMRFL